MTPDLAEKLQELQRIRAEHGEAAFQAALTEYAQEVIESGAIPSFAGAASNYVKNYQEEQSKAQEAATARRQQNDEAAQRMERKPLEVESDQGFLALLQKSMPGMRSQAQFNAFMTGFEALRGVMDGIFSGHPEAIQKYREALLKSLDAAQQVTDLTEKLTDVPEAATSKLAEDFKKPPYQFSEYDTQRALMSELEGLTTLDALTRWWTSNRQRIDEVRSPMLRNPLIDAVRAKKEALT